MEISMSMSLDWWSDRRIIMMALFDKSVGAQAMREYRTGKDYRKQVRWLKLYVSIRKRQLQKLGHCSDMIGGRGGPH